MSENAFHTDIKRERDLMFMRILIFISFDRKREATGMDRIVCEACARSVIYKAVVLYSRVNSIKSPSPGASNFSEPMLMSQVQIAQIRVHVDQRVCAMGTVGEPEFFCLRSSCYHVTEVGSP